MADFFDVITLSDILFALLAAFSLTYFINRVKGKYIFRGVYGGVRVMYDKNNLQAIVESCSEIFPSETISFNGRTFTRGSAIEVLTAEELKITGRFIGVNSENMICVIGKTHICAQKLSRVVSITAIDTEEL